MYTNIKYNVDIVSHFRDFSSILQEILRFESLMFVSCKTDVFRKHLPTASALSDCPALFFMI